MSFNINFKLVRCIESHKTTSTYVLFNTLTSNMITSNLSLSTGDLWWIKLVKSQEKGLVINHFLSIQFVIAQTNLLVITHSPLNVSWPHVHRLDNLDNHRILYTFFFMGFRCKLNECVNWKVIFNNTRQYLNMSASILQRTV